MLFAWPSTTVFRSPDRRDAPKLTRSDPDAMVLGYHERVCLRILIEHPAIQKAALADEELTIALLALRRVMLT